MMYIVGYFICGIICYLAMLAYMARNKFSEYFLGSLKRDMEEGEVWAFVLLFVLCLSWPLSLGTICLYWVFHALSKFSLFFMNKAAKKKPYPYRNNKELI